MLEVDFYSEIATTFSRALKGLDENIDVAFSLNKELPQMIQEIEDKLNCKTIFENSFIPNLKLDILFGIKKNDSIRLVLFEVKYAKNLTLSNYSQLIGYLQVAKRIEYGILFLVEKNNPSPNGLSNDFADILNSDMLPMNWSTNEFLQERTYHFTTGVCLWQSGARIKWKDVKRNNGISSFQDLINNI